MLVAHLGHAGGQIGGGDAGAFRPAGHGGLAGLGIDAGHKRVRAELLDGRLGEVGVAHKRGAQDDAGRAGVQQTVGGLEAAHAASHLDLEARGGEDLAYDLDIVGIAGFRAV